MAFGQKLFNAAFAKEASLPLVERQNQELEFLREQLLAIAAHEREKELTSITHQGAMAEAQLGEDQANFREILSQIGQSQRATTAREARQAEALADIGVDPAQLDPNTMLSALAEANRRRLEAESVEDAVKARQETLQWLLDFQEKSGVTISPEVLDDPEAFARFQQEYSVFQATERRDEDPIDFPLGIVDELAELGPTGADYADTLLSTYDAEGMNLSPLSRFYLLLGRAKALQGPNPLDGFNLASAVVEGYQESIIRRFYPDGRVPTSDELLKSEPEAQEHYQRMLNELQERMEDPYFSAFLKHESTFSVGEVTGRTPLTNQRVQEILANQGRLRSNAEEQGERRNQLESLGAPHQEQRTSFLTSLQQAVIEQAQTLQSPEELMALAQSIESELQVSMEQAGSIPGEEYLTMEDYQAGVELVNQLIQQILQEIQRQMELAQQQAQMSQETRPFKNATRPANSGPGGG